MRATRSHKAKQRNKGFFAVRLQSTPDGNQPLKHCGLTLSSSWNYCWWNEGVKLRSTECSAFAKQQSLRFNEISCFVDSVFFKIKLQLALRGRVLQTLISSGFRKKVQIFERSDVFFHSGIPLVVSHWVITCIVNRCCVNQRQQDPSEISLVPVESLINRSCHSIFTNSLLRQAFRDSAISNLAALETASNVTGQTAELLIYALLLANGRQKSCNKTGVSKLLHPLRWCNPPLSAVIFPTSFVEWKTTGNRPAASAGIPPPRSRTKGRT